MVASLFSCILQGDWRSALSTNNLCISPLADSIAQRRCIHIVFSLSELSQSSVPVSRGILSTKPKEDRFTKQTISQMTGKKRNRNFGSAFAPETKTCLK
jgi:hypothetical protein